jgi:NADP-dependent 3-hydroxy acid dehydrogenase YdfG
MSSTAQIVLVTGASSGFGRLIAETLARKGFTVFATMRDANGRNAASSRELEELAQRGPLSLQVLELDVTDDASVERAVREAVAKHRRIDGRTEQCGLRNHGPGGNGDRGAGAAAVRHKLLRRLADESGGSPGSRP